MDSPGQTAPRSRRPISRIRHTLLFASLAFWGVIPMRAQILQHPSFQSSSWNITFADRSPAITSLSIDGLGKGRFGPPARVEQSADAPVAVAEQREGWLRYFYPNESKAAWSFRCEGDMVVVESGIQQSAPLTPLTLRFRLSEMHATLLGRMVEDGGVKLPAILHLPGLGSIRVTTDSGATTVLGYDASRSGKGFVEGKRTTNPTIDAASWKVKSYWECVLRSMRPV